MVTCHSIIHANVHFNITIWYFPLLQPYGVPAVFGVGLWACYTNRRDCRRSSTQLYSTHQARHQLVWVKKIPFLADTCFGHSVRGWKNLQSSLVYEANHTIKQQHVNRPQGIYICVMKHKNNPFYWKKMNYNKTQSTLVFGSSSEDCAAVCVWERSAPLHSRWITHGKEHTTNICNIFILPP